MKTTELIQALRGTTSRSKRKLLDTAAECITTLAMLNNVLLQCTDESKLDEAIAGLERLMEEV